MNRRPLIWSLVATLAGLTAQAGPPPSLLALAQKMAGVQTVCLEFTQERDLKLFTDPLTSEGVLLLERPDKIRWETTSPYQTILLGSHTAVAQFERDDGAWEKLKLGFPQLLQKVMGQMSAMNQGDARAMLKDYTVTAVTNTEVVLRLTPRDAAAREMLSDLEVHLPLDLSTTREVVMKEPDGDRTRIRFRHEWRNITFPGGTFDQTHPLPVAAVMAAVKHAP